MKSKIRLFSYIIGPLILVGLYNNCGRAGFEAEMGLSSMSFSSMGGACDADLLATYSATWYPALSTNCNSCHGSAHGSTDLSVSYSAFMTKGTSLISYKASNPHGGNNVNLSNQISSFSGRWSSAQAAYMSCLSSNPTSGGGNPTGAQIALNAKAIAGVNQTIANQNNWRTVTWDLETEVPSSYMGQFAAIFTVEARYSLYSGTPVGFEFRNPRMRLKTATTPAIQVNAINLRIDNNPIPNVTTYTGVSAIISSTTATDVAPGASTALAIANVNDNSLISFVFTNLQSGASTTTTTLAGTTTTMPGAVVAKLSDLLGTNPNLNVFAQSCVGCHNASNAAGGFNITNSTQAISKASQIIARMTNAAQPMPTSGLLNSARVQIVQNWVNAGAPP